MPSWQVAAFAIAHAGVMYEASVPVLTTLLCCRLLWSESKRAHNVSPSRRNGTRFPLAARTCVQSADISLFIIPPVGAVKLLCPPNG